MGRRVKKKVLLLGVVAGCLALASGITYMTRSTSGIPAHFAREMTWIKCRNPKCGAEYQISKKEYFEYIERHHDPRLPAAVPLICKECSEKSLVRAVKCEKCGLVFPMGTVRRDYHDRCHNCGYSKLENEKKSAAGSGGG